MTLPLPCSFPGRSDSKESTCKAGDLGSVPGLGASPEEENGSPLQYSCLGNPMGISVALVGYRPWGRKESETTEQLTHPHVVYLQYLHLCAGVTLL